MRALLAAVAQCLWVGYLVIFPLNKSPTLEYNYNAFSPTFGVKVDPLSPRFPLILKGSLGVQSVTVWTLSPRNIVVWLFVCCDLLVIDFSRISAVPSSLLFQPGYTLI